MNRFKNILFVADGSKGEEAALRKVFELAELNGAKVTLISALEEHSNRYYLWDNQNTMAKLHQELLKAQENKLKKLLSDCKPKGSKVTTKSIVKEGTPHVQIIKTVIAEGYDLLAKANHNDSLLANMLFGTLDMDLLRKCPCPVYIIKPRKKIRHAKILAAVDLLRGKKKQANLDRLIMDLATSLSVMEEGSLDMIHAWSFPHEKRLKNEERVGFYKSVATLKRELRKVEKDHLDQLQQEYAEFQPQAHMLRGEPEIVIPRFARSHRMDLVVMGTVARTGVAGFFIGNTAERILHNLNCSVLAVKPEGFKSPVK